MVIAKLVKCGPSTKVFMYINHSQPLNFSSSESLLLVIYRFGGVFVGNLECLVMPKQAMKN